jgi:FAD/FMN-containing dehydrogenase
MRALRTLNGATARLSSDALGALETGFRGRLIDEAHQEYDEARRVWNGFIDKRPGMIAKCSGLADVVSAVNFARDHNLLLSVRGGGHNVSGSAVCDGGLSSTSQKCGSSALIARRTVSMCRAARH